jgi:hypothetical protein
MIARHGVIRFLGCALLVLLLVPAALAETAPPFSGRAVLYQKASTADFKAVVRGFTNPHEAMVPDRELKPSGIYLRLTPRVYAIDDKGQLKANAVLGCKPFVFMTVAQAGFGRSLYDIYADIGYDATEILGQRGVAMVALLFRYRDAVTLSPVRDGKLEPNIREHVYVPVWRNAFALFSRLAEETPPAGGNPCMSLSLKPHEADLARYFVPSGLERISRMPYALLRALGGPDWEYRQLLESKMGMNAHFLGTGITENTLSPADQRKGLPEFVGPNRVIAELPEAAVIDLGHMEFVEVHETY